MSKKKKVEKEQEIKRPMIKRRQPNRSVGGDIGINRDSRKIK